ncbi:MAG: sigma-70 family RNA polymerase sigma factor [Clostridiales bacterium]|jgi:RNA polymerase sigma-70 factor (ECF subfamily)|nr:sigma-70 family RNA polymerase sigma factor [Clostridiales bacterium]
MATVNLRDFYPWYTQDEFVEVSDEVAVELLADKRYHKTYERRMRYNKTYLFDADTETEAATIAHTTDTPEALVLRMEQHCRLCRALNSLPQMQGRRIEAHFLLGKSREEIAEGVSESAVNQSIERGLRAMKTFLRDSQNGLVKCPSRPL